MERGSLTICGRSARPNNAVACFELGVWSIGRQLGAARSEDAPSRTWRRSGRLRRRYRLICQAAPTKSSTRLELFAVHSESSVVSKMTESNLPSRQFPSATSVSGPDVVNSSGTYPEGEGP